MSISIEEARAKHTNDLMDRPGVVSVGLGLNEAGEEAIVIGLSETPAADAPAFPTSLDGHPVVVQVIGEIRAR